MQLGPEKKFFCKHHYTNYLFQSTCHSGWYLSLACPLSYLEEPLIVTGSSLILRQFDNLTVNLSMNKYENNLYQSLLMGDYPEEGELIQLITDDDEEQVQPDNYPEIIPILSVRNTVLFPGV